MLRSILALLIPLSARLPLSAREAQLMRYPDYYGGQIVFMYRGGTNADVWVYDFERRTFEQLTRFLGNDIWPMRGRAASTSLPQVSAWCLRPTATSSRCPRSMASGAP